MKTVIEMAIEAGITPQQRPQPAWIAQWCATKELERFAELVRADERERIAKWYETTGHMMFPVAIPNAIRDNT